MSSLRTILDYLAEEHGAPRLKKAIPRVTRPAPRAVTATDAERTTLLAAAKPWLRCWILLCSDMALRSGTAARIAPEHYNAQRREITFVTKFGVAQTLPVTDELASLFALANPSNPASFVAQLSKLGRISIRYARNAFAALRKEVNITRKLTAHDLRRTTGTNVYEITKDLRVVQAVLGHKNLSTTLYYLDHRNTPVPRGLLELAKLNPEKETIQ